MLPAEPGAPGEITGNVQAVDRSNAAALLSTGELHMTSKVEMRLAAKDLRSKDAFGKSDPMAVLFENVGDCWVERGRTEVKTNDHSPEFVTAFVLTYAFETSQPFKVEIYDVDVNLHGGSGAALDLKKQCDFLGHAEFVLAQVLQDRSVPSKMNFKKGQGELIVWVQEQKNCKLSLQGTIGCSKISNRGFSAFTDVPDPFIRISRHAILRKGTKLIPVWESGVVKNQTTASWPIDISLLSLCQADLKTQLQLEVYDWEKSGSHRCLGVVQVTAQDISQGTKRLTLNHPKKDKQTKAELVFESMHLVERPTFLDYLNGGLQIGFTVAIDFTGSNRPPEMRDSLHNLLRSPNQYEAAIQGVGHIIDYYNATKTYTAWAFGCVPVQEGANTADHCYPLNGNRSNPVVQGIPGIMEAYRHCLSTTQLSGPTYFAPVVRATCDVAKACPPGRKYECLLILTDGAVTDAKDTIEAIIDAAMHAMSIIIIGIGDADFGAMEVLDADRTGLRADGKTAARDIVQFVPFNVHKGNPTALASEIGNTDCTCPQPRLFVVCRKKQIRPGPRHASPSGVPPPADAGYPAAAAGNAPGVGAADAACVGYPVPGYYPAASGQAQYPDPNV